MSRELERPRGRTKSVERSPSSARPKEAERIAIRPDTAGRRPASRSLSRQRQASSHGLGQDQVAQDGLQQQDEPLPSYGRITKGADDVLALYNGDEAEYDTVNTLFLALQAHFPPTSARHVCLTHDRALYAHIVGDVVRLHAHLTSQSPSHSLAARIRAATYFYLHRVAVAFHRSTMTRPPLVKGDPTAPAAFHHRLSLMHMYGRIVKHLERRDAQMGAAERVERGRPASPSQRTRSGSAQRRADDAELSRDRPPTARARSSESRPGSSSPTRLLGSRSPSHSPTRGLSLDRHLAQSPLHSPERDDQDPDLPDESAADVQFDWRLVCHAESVLVDLATRHGMTESIPAKCDRLWPTHSIDLAVPLPRQLLALLADPNPFPPPNTAAPEDWTQAVHDVALVAHLLALITLSRHGA
ncbi:hypothetical protein AMAG_06864 [Allomyces macrogynus ATCC 38327]|uniref:Uncharacterized protein n=1 Tax=Allomyces macrogynus (strain ATCC 38327) TaxID=578462 RepID=A0A0L0SF89_ALLM3|nr:hypothetical protein AMAG_06864 [Allomyces macrogynus ATCC 38327]|eukprot:KNE61112.1 hypothetical protein AMAG_06864 [Allomyces macrogynus ATCC 38327]